MRTPIYTCLQMTLKLYREMSDVTDVTTLQSDITEMEKWSNEWLMSFHPTKCKVLILGRPISDLSDIFNPYTLSDHHLEVVENEKDIIIDCELSFDKHIAEKVNKATKIVYVIRRSFMYLDEEIFLNLYKALVRPHLEYANQIWSPWLQRQIHSIENVQKRATKLLPGYDNLSYEERLKKLRLPTLTNRRLRGDLIETYKILTNKYDPEICENFIELRKDSNTRGHSLKIYKQRCKLNVRKNCFPAVWREVRQKTEGTGNLLWLKSQIENQNCRHRKSNTCSGIYRSGIWGLTACHQKRIL